MGPWTDWILLDLVEEMLTPAVRPISTVLLTSTMRNYAGFAGGVYYNAYPVGPILSACSSDI